MEASLTLIRLFRFHKIMITAEHFVETTDNYAYEFNQIL